MAIDLGFGVTRLRAKLVGAGVTLLAATITGDLNFLFVRMEYGFLVIRLELLVSN